MRGYVHVYTGDDEDAAPEVGLCLRAAGAGLKALVIACIENDDDGGKIRALERFSEHVTVDPYGTDRLDRIRRAVSGGRYDLVVVDKGNVAVDRGLFSAEDLLEIIRNRPSPVELVITGKGADPRIVEAADLVTEMTRVKHQPKRGERVGNGI